MAGSLYTFNRQILWCWLVKSTYVRTIDCFLPESSFLQKRRTLQSWANEHSRERAHKPTSHKPRSGQNIFSNGGGGKRSKIVFSSGPEESEILRGKVGPRTCKGRELWSQNVADMHFRREKSISGGDRWQRPVSFQLFARLSLIADNPPSTSPKFCGHLR